MKSQVRLIGFAVLASLAALLMIALPSAAAAANSCRLMLNSSPSAIDSSAAVSLPVKPQQRRRPSRLGTAALQHNLPLSQDCSRAH